MSVQPLSYGTTRKPAGLLSARRFIAAAIGLSAGVAITAAIDLGPHVAAKTLAPISLLSLRYSGHDIMLAVILLVVQWPLYGLLIGYSWPGSRRSRLALLAIIAAWHTTAVVLCFRLMA